MLRRGFSKFVGNCSANVAEFWGVLEGLYLLKKLGYAQVEINVDSAIVVKVIEEGNVEMVDCVAILWRIMEVMSTLEVVIINI